MKKYAIVFLGAAVLFSCKKKTEPTVCISADQTDVLVGEVIQFTNCSENYLSSEWNFGDGSNTNVTDPSHRFGESGTHTVHLKVVDMEGTSAKTTSTITVNDLLLKQIDIVDGDLSNQNIRWTFTFDGKTLKAGGDITESSFGSSLSYIWAIGTEVTDGKHIFTAEKEELDNSGWFPMYTTVYSNEWQINPYEDLGSETKLESSDSSEGITITYNFERSTGE